MAEGDALRKIAARFGVEFDAAQLVAGKAAINGVVGALGGLARVLGVVGVAFAIREFAVSTAELGEHLAVTSQRLGITTHELQEIQTAAGQTGVQTEVLDASLNRLNLSMGRAETGGRRQSAAFAQLGVHTRDAQGHTRSLSDVLDDVAQNMDHIESPARRAAIAQDLLGRAGGRLLPILHGGAGGLRELRGRLDELGGGMSEGAVQSAEQMAHAMADWRTAMLSVRSVLAVQVLPLLTSLLRTVTSVVGTFATWARTSQEAGHIFGQLVTPLDGVRRGVVFVTAALAILWASPIVAFFLGLYLVVKDLIVLFHGGHSAIGHVIDGLFGVGAASRFVREVTDDFRILVNEVLPAVGRWFTETWASIVRGFRRTIEDLQTDFDAVSAAFGHETEHARAIRLARQQQFTTGQGGLAVGLGALRNVIATRANAAARVPASGHGGTTHIAAPIRVEFHNAVLGARNEVLSVVQQLTRAVEQGVTNAHRAATRQNDNNHPLPQRT